MFAKEETATEALISGINFLNAAGSIPSNCFIVPNKSKVPSSNLLASISASNIAFAAASVGAVKAIIAPRNAVVDSAVLIPPAVKEAIAAPTADKETPELFATGRTLPSDPANSSIVVLPSLTVVNKTSLTSFT